MATPLLSGWNETAWAPTLLVLTPRNERKVPAASSATTWPALRGRPRAPDTPVRVRPVPPAPACTVYRPVAGSHTPTAARGSIVTPVTRWTNVSSLTTWAARANTASTVAASPTSTSTHTLDVVPSYRMGAPAAAAARLAVVAGS